MPTLSVCLIVRDEEPVLARCLSAAASFADEIVVVDTGSRDRSRDIARRFTPHVLDYPWEDDFAAARNFSFQQATGDYLMWLDADDVVPPQDAGRLRSLMVTLPPETDLVLTPYRQWTQEPLLADYVLRERIIRRTLGARWIFPIHEVIPIRPEWNVLCTRAISIYHHKLVVNEPGRNLRIFHTQMARNWTLNFFNRSYYCRELCDNGDYEACARYFRALWGDGAPAHCLDYALPFYAHAMGKLGRYAPLARDLLDYHRQFGGNEYLYFALAQCYDRLGDWDQAEGWYRACLALEIHPEDLQVHCDALVSLLPWLELAKLCHNQGRDSQARDCLEQARRLSPRHPGVRFLGLCLENRARRNRGQKI